LGREPALLLKWLNRDATLLLEKGTVLGCDRRAGEHELPRHLQGLGLHGIMLRRGLQGLYGGRESTRLEHVSAFQRNTSMALQPQPD
jgi:hypothetical protein